MTPDDYGWLFDLAVGTPAGSRWRLHGEVPTFDSFVGGLLRGATATCAIEALDGRPLGMVQLWQHDHLSRHAQLTAFVDPTVEGRGWPLEGIVLFIDYVFAAFDLRKLYLETLATELTTFGSLVGTVLREEGRLLGHRYVFGEHVDCHLLALYREDFHRAASSLLPSTMEHGRGPG